MKRLLVLLSIMLLLPLWALAVTTVPGHVTYVEDDAFANTAIDALIVPATVKAVGADVLAGSGASYIYLKGSDTTLANGGGVPFVFGPASSKAAGLANFYEESSLIVTDGVYYHVTGIALPLCAQEPGTMSGSITIPKLLGDVPVTSVAKLYLSNTALAEVRVPAYLGQVAGVKTVPYQTMTLTAPVADQAEAPAGTTITWTVNAQGAYGNVTYEWVFEQEGQTITAFTAEPTVRYAPMKAGECSVTVTAQDAVGDSASASGGKVTLTAAQTTYRALLVCNTYPGTADELAGPQTDLAAMRQMLQSMSGTPFKVSAVTNTNANGMQAAIARTFAGATAADVSLFYFSGHGTSQGALVGTGNTYLSVYGLRSALQNIPGTKIVLLDCCYSGQAINRSTDSASAFNRAVISAFSSASRSAENLEDMGYIVLTACRKDQEAASIIAGPMSFGAFTYGVCYGSGYDELNQMSLGRLPADSNGDNAISLIEAYQGVQERISFLNMSMPFPLEQAVQYYGDSSFVLWSK